MRETKHTPGPWNALADEDGAFEVESDTHIVAMRGPLTHKSEESIANCRLIAAAPELLEALKDALNCILLTTGMSEAKFRCTWQNALAAIAKAEGRS
jgi:hypothetical protein